jgi:hypothetical protein
VYVQAQKGATRALKIGVYINLLGMLFALVSG